jgi:hypothetical protein
LITAVISDVTLGFSDYQQLVPKERQLNLLEK